MVILTAKPIIATRPTKSSFCLVKPIPPEVPKIPSSIFSFCFGGATCPNSKINKIEQIKGGKLYKVYLAKNDKYLMTLSTFYSD